MMRKSLLVLCSLILVVAITGCIRAYKFTKERVDINVSGNQGVIYGPTPAPHKVACPSRELYGVDIELPTGEEVKGTFKKKGAVPQQPAQCMTDTERKRAPISQKEEKIK